MTIRRLLSINDLIGTILGGAVNSLLLFILYKMEKHEINNYKRILYLVTITDLLLALSNSIVMMSMETYNGYIIIFTEELTLVILSLIIWHAISLIVLSFCIIPSDDPSYKHIIKLIEESYKYELIEYGREVIILNIFLIYGLIYNVYLFLVSFIAVIIIYYSYYKIRKELKSQKNSMSPKSISLQNQLNLVMFCHALVPMFLSFTPILIFEASDYFQFNIKGLGTLLFFSIEWVPFISGLISLTMINACRRKFLKMINFRSSMQSSHVIPAQQNYRHSNIRISSYVE
ncbi:7TM GPCR, serpentine receptor class d (Srd) family-containing protein [Strongyloides ratti]|uniref:7TM GPCR, serpentine receptor class d (Srd) family-containing protein n=1 Tax=Strongyloides ratti TaxID=34506 RepID=A0A090MZY9_STRRB|nr:7TM GPCR, serpentine receptor class d (Srd) family-containing protein [Strongyloides ratti]CEF69765.1 7TM GPCR, serpentine receptor class d (Srd) family-containing protein [Strongyloides ratti]